MAIRWSHAFILVAALVGCTSSTDSLGTNETAFVDAGPPPKTLAPLTGPSSYPNPFRDVLGKPEPEIESKIKALFEHLFYSDPNGPNTSAIYFPDEVEPDQSFVRDVLHGDIRTEGIGLGMMFAVQMNERDIFDRLFRWVKAKRRETGASDGYYRSKCDISNTMTVDCLDPFGMQQMAMALVFAHGRYGSDGSIDYEAEAFELFDAMRRPREGGEILSLFDADTGLVFDEPKLASAHLVRPSCVMAAYYQLWAQATGDSFFSTAAARAREFLARTAHPMTGLVPLRSYPSGAPVPNSDRFQHEGYRVWTTIATDHAWFAGDPWQVAEANSVLGFFDDDIGTYGGVFTLDGMELESIHEPALVAANGAIALPATVPGRREFIQAVWDLEPPTGGTRYFTGIMQLWSLMILGGQFRIY